MCLKMWLVHLYLCVALKRRRVVEEHLLLLLFAGLVLLPFLSACLFEFENVVCRFWKGMKRIGALVA